MRGCGQKAGAAFRLPKRRLQKRPSDVPVRAINPELTIEKKADETGRLRR
jgi:hypothetical protein